MVKLSGFTHPLVASSSGDGRFDTQSAKPTSGVPSRRALALATPSSAWKIDGCGGAFGDDVVGGGIFIKRWYRGQPKLIIGTII